jgi:hypothetical protein
MDLMLAIRNLTLAPNGALRNNVKFLGVDGHVPCSWKSRTEIQLIEEMHVFLTVNLLRECLDYFPRQSRHRPLKMATPKTRTSTLPMWQTLKELSISFAAHSRLSATSANRTEGKFLYAIE